MGNRIPVKLSLIYYYLVLSVHVVTGVVVFVIGLPVFVAVAIVLFVVMHYLWFLRGVKQLKAVTALIIDRRTLFVERGMTREEVTILRPVLLNRYIVLLRVRVDQRILVLILLRDTASVSDLRTLRTWLKANSVACI